MNRRDAPGSGSGSGSGSGIRRGPVRRVLIAPSGYSTTVSPYSGQCFGIALPIFVATVVASVLYAVSLILILATDCKFTSNVIYFFSFLLLALLSTVAMAAVNVSYPRYTFNIVSLTTSLFYSGSAALILFGLIFISIEGLCKAERAVEISPSPNPDPTRIPAPSLPTGGYPTTDQPTNTPPYFGYEILRTQFTNQPWRDGSFAAGNKTVGLWKSKYAPNYCIWVFSAIGFCFQVAAHFYYG